MRYFVSVVCVLAMSLVSVASPAYAQELKLSLTLRPSYFYNVDVDPVSAQPEPKGTTEGEPVSAQPEPKGTTEGESESTEQSLRERHEESGSRLERWHPEAFAQPSKSDTGAQPMGSPEKQQRQKKEFSRGQKAGIAIGAILGAGVCMGIAAAVVSANIML
jgi:hypothetical protein